MIHLSEISINVSAIVYINWRAKLDSKTKGVRVFLNYASQSYYSEDTKFFLEDSEDAKTLARELKRPGWSKWQPAFEPSPGSLLPDAE